MRAQWSSEPRATRNLAAVAALGVALMAGVIGCGEGAPKAEGARAAKQTLSEAPGAAATEAPEPTDTESSSSADLPGSPGPTAKPERADPAARKLVRRGVANLVKANTGAYKLEVVGRGGGGFSITEVGRYIIEPNASEFYRTLRGGELSATVAYKVVGEDSWMRLLSVGDGEKRSTWDCWVGVRDFIELPESAELVENSAAYIAVPGNYGAPPNPVSILAWGKGERIVAERRAAGTTDLVTALGLLGGRLVQETGIDINSDARVPATFKVAYGGWLSAYDIEIDDLNDALRSEVGDGFWLGESDEHTGISVFFGPVGEPVEIQPPSPEEVVDFAGFDSAESAMKACGT